MQKRRCSLVARHLAGCLYSAQRYSWYLPGGSIQRRHCCTTRGQYSPSMSTMPSGHAAGVGAGASMSSPCAATVDGERAPNGSGAPRVHATTRIANDANAIAIRERAEDDADVGAEE